MFAVDVERGNTAFNLVHQTGKSYKGFDLALIKKDGSRCYVETSISLKKGADGVLIMGCYPGDCHYNTGFMKAERRINALKEILEVVGINSKRVKIVSVSASEGKKLSKLIREFVDEIEQFKPVGAELVPETRIR